MNSETSALEAGSFTLACSRVKYVRRDFLSAPRVWLCPALGYIICSFDAIILYAEYWYAIGTRVSAANLDIVPMMNCIRAHICLEFVRMCCMCELRICCCCCCCCITKFGYKRSSSAIPIALGVRMSLYRLLIDAVLFCSLRTAVALLLVARKARPSYFHLSRALFIFSFVCLSLNSLPFVLIKQSPLAGSRLFIHSDCYFANTRPEKGDRFHCWTTAINDNRKSYNCQE